MGNQYKHPNPQFARTTCQDLNGEWDFGFKKAARGFRFSKDFSRAEKLCAAASYPLRIQVPFCPESVLSGIGYTDFINLAWYRKSVQIQKGDGRVFLHIGAADYLTTVLVNGKPAGRHTGGYTSFAFEITDLVREGENELFILCEDDTRNGLVPSGKQSTRKKSYACSYTRTTGIWQSVYLEYTPQNYIESIRLYPDPSAGSVTVHAALCGKGDLRCEASYKGKSVGVQEIKNACGATVVQIPLAETHLWEAGHGRLYDLRLTFSGDTVESYFGLRAVRLDGLRFLINEKSVFQRLVLDQGYYRDGIYTAPDDAALIRDIELAQSVGFNGARLHQKVFDPRFLYFCDRYGYLVWGEFGSWGLDTSAPAALEVFLPQWLEALARDCNHPCIVGWCPFNETWDTHGRKQRDGLLAAVYDATKAFDPTRPCIDTSGNFHVKTDIYDVHDYRYDPAEFKASFGRLETDGELYEHVLQDHPGRQQYNGEPTFVSEYGGIKWAADAQYKSWGYGEDVHNETDFAARYAGLTVALTGNRKMFGFCYTQLYDVEQEQNGLFTYDRAPKFSDETYQKIKAANEAPAAIEAKTKLCQLGDGYGWEELYFDPVSGQFSIRKCHCGWIDDAEEYDDGEYTVSSLTALEKLIRNNELETALRYRDELYIHEDLPVILEKLTSEQKAAGSTARPRTFALMEDKAVDYYMFSADDFAAYYEHCFYAIHCGKEPSPAKVDFSVVKRILEKTEPVTHCTYCYTYGWQKKEL